MTTRKAMSEGNRVFHAVCEIMIALHKKMLQETRDSPFSKDPESNLAYAKGIHAAFCRLVETFNQEIDKGKL